MSNSQEQSLDENAVFLPVIPSSPEFLYSEKERQAVERLLSAGPEAFYSSIGTECSGCFLSPEEVSQITSWAQDFRLRQPQFQREEENKEEHHSEAVDFSSTYFPSHSDTPAPCLELGWPEKLPWPRKGSVTVHTSPPAEGEAPVREIIRWHLQKACKVIAIVTDKLTDGTIIGDLHNTASRGVPVYIILNQRSMQENFTLNRLGHPNIVVRVLGGKTFCSRTGRMVAGELKDKFLLVDLETVIHGSYSLTWSDAHLHRQLITVLSGSIVDSFDKEFRILFAASFPVPEVWRVAGTHMDVTHQLKDSTDYSSPKRFPLKYDIANPPSPPINSPLDWEAMGVIQRFPLNPPDQEEDIVAKETPLHNHMLADKKTRVTDGFTLNGYETRATRRLYEKTSPVTLNVPDKSRASNNVQSSPTYSPTPEIMKLVERKIEKAISKQLSEEESTASDDRTTMPDDRGVESQQNMIILSSTKRKSGLRMEPSLVEETSEDKTGSRLENTPSSRKPLILRVPQPESFSSLSDIMKRIHPQQSTAGQLRRGSKFAMSEMSQSMLDLRVSNTDKDQDEKRVPRPRLNINSFGLELTPAFTLMRKRNDEIKSSLYRTPKTFLPRDRPRSSSYALNTNWRSIKENKDEEE
ncbi:protein FAM83A [Aulostomus maculatus]